MATGGALASLEFRAQQSDEEYLYLHPFYALQSTIIENRLLFQAFFFLMVSAKKQLISFFTEIFSLYIQGVSQTLGSMIYFLSYSPPEEYRF